jgi:hypothetical protein
MAMLFTLLALQMRPSEVYEVTSILSMLQPADGRLSSVDDVMVRPPACCEEHVIGDAV